MKINEHIKDVKLYTQHAKTSLKHKFQNIPNINDKSNKEHFNKIKD